MAEGSEYVSGKTLVHFMDEDLLDITCDSMVIEDIKEVRKYNFYRIKTTYESVTT